MPSSESAHSCSSDISDSSTLTYSHTPFDQYATQVRQLCRLLWPSATEDFVIERLQGGSYNRIIGITVPPSVGSDQGSYILRVPRFDQGQQESEIAILRYVRDHTSIPVARVTHSDPTRDNPLDSSYVIQSRIPGRTLYHTYRSLNHEQQKSVAADVGRIFLAQQAVRNEKAGVVKASTNKDDTYTYDVGRFAVDPEPDMVMQDEISLETSPVLNMFRDMFKRWDASVMQFYPAAGIKAQLFRQLTTVAGEMDAAGLFKDMPFCLCHLDLEPRNVIVDYDSDSSARISGVLDWDSAVFAPIFAACSPPSWIWSWEENEEEDKAKANDTPATAEMQELKQIFEQTVGPQFLIYSYDARYRQARELFELALHGIVTSEAWDSAKSLIDKWASTEEDVELSDEEEIGKLESGGEESGDEDSEGNVSDEVSTSAPNGISNIISSGNGSSLSTDNVSVDEVASSESVADMTKTTSHETLPRVDCLSSGKDEKKGAKDHESKVEDIIATLQQTTKSKAHAYIDIQSTMPKIGSKTTHHCGLKGSKCRVHGGICQEHQNWCKEHGMFFLKSQECPTHKGEREAKERDAHKLKLKQEAAAEAEKKKKAGGSAGGHKGKGKAK
ncbi:MAG: hypothetical protein Q9216_002671 [Gyalolechia sp. 2 TL-2023]